MTGGAGYIGSHTCLELLRSDHEVTVIDNLCNSDSESLRRVQRLSNRTLEFYQCDIRNTRELSKIFSDYKPDAVIHFAGLKSVGKSVLEPSQYYEVNVGGTATLLSAMDKSGCKKIVFSSSATVYGEPKYLPCDERHPLNPINPYGRTKLIAENLLQDWTNAEKGRSAIALRYFNPVGADISGEIGENPVGVPTNLMPYISQVAVGRMDRLEIFGDDYDTVDGTGVRDYVHVVDLAHAHISAVEKIEKLEPFEAINIGTGKGLSVLQMLNEFERQSGRTVKKKKSPRRLGDAASVYADVSKALKKLNFTTKREVSEMCKDTWNWQRRNPGGY